MAKRVATDVDLAWLDEEPDPKEMRRSDAEDLARAIVASPIPAGWATKVCLRDCSWVDQLPGCDRCEVRSARCCGNLGISCKDCPKNPGRLLQQAREYAYAEAGLPPPT